MSWRVTSAVLRSVVVPLVFYAAVPGMLCIGRREPVLRTTAFWAREGSVRRGPHVRIAEKKDEGRK